MATKEKKRKYKLLGGASDPMVFQNQDPDYHYHGFNDDPRRPGRIAAAIEAGYEEVVSEQPMGEGGVNTPKKMGGGVTYPAGPGITGVLMRIPKKLYEEHQREKQKEVDESEAAIKRHAHGPNRYGKIDIGKMTND